MFCMCSTLLEKLKSQRSDGSDTWREWEKIVLRTERNWDDRKDVDRSDVVGTAGAMESRKT